MPQIDLLSSFQGNVMDSMFNQVFGDNYSLSSHAADAATLVLDTIQYNEDQAKAAYSYVFEFLADQEGHKVAPPGWKPQMTGLHLTPAPVGKGRSMWVSKEGRGRFEMYGEDAIKKIPEC